MAEEISQATYQQWADHIATYGRVFAAWEARSKKIIERYTDKLDTDQRETPARFNILWSNVQTLSAATYARLPKADASRRFNDSDPVGRVASLILERALDYEIAHYPDYGATMSASVLDRFLCARATSWVRYDAKNLKKPEQVTEDTESPPPPELDYECAPCDYVHWRDFGHTIARTWEEVTAVWRAVYMTKESLVARFGKELGSKIPLDAKPEELKRVAGGASNEPQVSRGLIHEIWDKETRKVYWISTSLGKVVDEKDDPLKLVNFFPCPKPLYGTLTNESLIPTPDYCQYQYQAETLDVLAQRIEEYCDAMRVVGTYDNSIPEIRRVFTELGNTQMVGVTNWAAYAEKGGVTGAVQFAELKPIYEALAQSYVAFEQLKNQIYEITRISDIMRGYVNPREKLGQSELKSQYGNLGIHAYQWQVAQYATELLQIKAQIICNKFDPQTIVKIASVSELLPQDQQLVPQAMALLLGPRLQDPNSDSPNPLRGFRIEVAADSLVKLDEMEERDARMSLVKVNADMLKELLVAAQAGPMGAVLAPLVMQQWKFAMSSFHIGKQIEGAFDSATDQLRQIAMAPKPEAPPDPNMVRAQNDAMLQKERQDFEVEKARQQQAFDVQKLEYENTRTAEQQQLEAATEQHKATVSGNVEMEKMRLQHALDMKKQDDEQAFQKWKVQTETEAKIQIAMIQAGIKGEDGESATNSVNDIKTGVEKIRERMDRSAPEDEEYNAVRDMNGDMVAVQIKRSDGTVKTRKVNMNRTLN